jgi:hypothetical protein
MTDAGDDTESEPDAGQPGSIPGWRMAWAVQAGGASSDHEWGREVAALADGSSVVTGTFYFGSIFGEGTPGETGVTAQQSGIFVARYDSNGALDWVEAADGPSLDHGSAIAVSDQADVIVTGRYCSEAVFGAGQDNETTINGYGENQETDGFVAAYDLVGQLSWVGNFHGPGSGEGRDVSPLVGGSVLIAGFFEGMVVFDPGGADETTLTTTGADSFVAKYGPDGSLHWAMEIGGTGVARGARVAARDDGSFYVAGSFRNELVLGAGGEAETTLNTAGDESYFLALFEADGSLVWAKDVGIDGTVYGTLFPGALMALPDDGGCVLGGGFHGTAVLGAGGPNETVITTPDSPEDINHDILLARYSDDGSLEWAKTGGGFDKDNIANGALLDDGTIVVGGTFLYDAVFGEGEPNETVLTSAKPGPREAFIAAYAPDGQLVWALGLGGDGDDRVWGVNTLADESIFASGHFSQSVTFGTGPDDAVDLTSAGDSDIFLLRLDRFDPPS